MATVLLATGCSLPHERTETGASKIAITQVDAEAIYARYARVRRSALRLLDPQPLTSIETGPVLAIDSGALQVARRLLLTEKVDDNQNLEIQQVLAPRLTSYPLWFVAVVRDGVRKLTKVQIFTRETSVSTWQLVASPETLTTVDLPGFAVDDQGALAPVAPTTTTACRCHRPTRSLRTSVRSTPPAVPRRTGRTTPRRQLGRRSAPRTRNWVDRATCPTPAATAPLVRVRSRLRLPAEDRAAPTTKPTPAG